ncbi:MAG TPA: NUDIX hydrolase [Myxococcaceae bacterium]|nr:NUDIX hydrolase [Myxococcaceae bacterium]
MTSPPQPWKRIELLRALDFGIFKVNEYRAQDPRNGSEHPRVHLDARDAVSVMPLLPDGRVLMVRQFRFGIEANTLEFPAGMVEEGETPEVAGARELEEETGHRPERMVSLGWIHPNPAWQNNRQHLFLALGCQQIHQGKPDEGEDIAVELVPRSRLSELVISGEVTHESVLALLYRESIQGREA